MAPISGARSSAPTTAWPISPVGPVTATVRRAGLAGWEGIPEVVAHLYRAATGRRGGAQTRSLAPQARRDAPRASRLSESASSASTAGGMIHQAETSVVA